jgi:tetratricopeptide (TPR) repeat protein
MLRNALIAVAALALTCALVVGGIGIGSAAGAPEPLVPVLLAVGQAVTLIALSAILFAITLLPPQSPESSAVPPDLTESLKELRAAVDAIPRVHPQIDSAVVPPEPAPAPTGAANIAHVSDELQQVHELLRELRHLAMLNDTQRQELLSSTRRQRWEQFQAEVDRCIVRGLWAEADKGLAAFAAEFPADAQLQSLRARLAQERDHAMRPALRQLEERVEDLTAVGSWDRARALATQFVENYPDSRQAAELLARLNHNSEIARDESAQRLYQEIKSDVDRRHWRRALAGAQKLMEQFPGHRRAATIREQLATIAENAEIEERQELERSIQELVRAKQFAEAIDLAERLLDRFPASPQAESLQKLLPKMRELAIEREVESEP